MILTRPVGKQARSIAEATARFNFWHGAVRSSKTIGSILAFLEYLASTKNDQHVVAGKTERTLRRNVVGPMRDILGPGVMSVSWGLGEIRLFGKTLFMVGANDTRSEEKLRGLTAGGAYIDELTTWPREVFEMLRSRCSMAGARMFATSNPDSPRHWAKKNLLDRQPGLDMRSWHFTIDDNPNLDPEFVANLKLEYVGLWYKRFIDGLWVMAEGAIWDMFSDALVVDELPRMTAYYVCCDYGTAAPFVALLVGKSAAEAEPDRIPRFYVCREWRWDSSEKLRQLTDSEYSRELKKWLASYRVSPSAWYVDPSALSFMLQLKRDKVARVQAADNSVGDGLRSVGTLLANDLLRVHKSCKGLIEEIYGYIWDEDAQEKGEDKPVKKDDHGPDALRYGVRMLTSIWQHSLKMLADQRRAA